MAFFCLKRRLIPLNQTASNTLAILVAFCIESLTTMDLGSCDMHVCMFHSFKGGLNIAEGRNTFRSSWSTKKLTNCLSKSFYFHTLGRIHFYARSTLLDHTSICSEFLNIVRSNLKCSPRPMSNDSREKSKCRPLT